MYQFQNSSDFVAQLFKRDQRDSFPFALKTIREEELCVYYEEEGRDGSFGSVRRASFISSGMSCAIKYVDVLCVGTATHSDKKALAAYEAHLMDEFRHKNIVDVFAWNDESAFIVMEWADFDLEHYREQLVARYFNHTEKLDCKCRKLASQVKDQIGEAIAFLHSRGVIHLDINPRNILVFETGVGKYVFKVGDFGLSRKKRGEIFEHPQKFSGGIPGYRSPEVKHSIFTPAADVFSLGSVLWFVLKGRPFFPGEQEEDHPYGDFIKKCTHVDLWQRPTMSEFLKFKPPG